MTRNIPRVYLDLDGTITDVMPRYYKIFKDFFESDIGEAFPISYSIYVELKRKRIKEEYMLKAYRNFTFNCDKYKFFKRENLESLRYLELDRLICDVKNITRNLKRSGYHVCLLSQRRKRENAILQLKNLKIEQYFDEIVILHPSKDNVKRTYLANIVSNKDVIIGDSPIEMECASANQMQGYFVKTGLFGEDFAGEHMVFNNCKEAIEFIINQKSSKWM